MINLTSKILRTLLSPSRYLCTTSIQQNYNLLYSERPFTPNQFAIMSTVYIYRHRQHMLDHLLHGVRLMNMGVIPFSYDYYEWSCGRLIEAQEVLTKEQILLMLELGRQYKIRIEPFLEHMENQLFMRVHRDYHCQIAEYDVQIQQEKTKLFKELEAKSQDYFGLLNQTEKEEREEELEDAKQAKIEEKIEQPTSVNENEKLIIQISERMKKKSKQTKQITLSDLFQIGSILKSNGSKNLSFIQYLLQLLTVKMQQKPALTAQQTLQYLKQLTFASQSLMAQYSANKSKYTVRSVKRIYKYQTFYFLQHFRQLQQTGDSLSNQQLQEMIDIYGMFPIKRRVLKKTIGKLMSEQLQKRGLLGREDLTTKLIAINMKDQKMKKQFRQFLGIPEPVIVEEPKTITQQTNIQNTSETIDQKMDVAKQMGEQIAAKQQLRAG